MSGKPRAWVLAVVTVVLAACGSSDPGVADTEAGGEADAFEIQADDYEYPNLPDSLAVGTELQMVNQSDAEAHEAVVFRLPDGEERSIEELLELPDEEADVLFEEGFKGVLIALPGEAALAPEGPVVLDEEGRYVVVCFLPIGHDPEELAAAMEEEEGAEGPPDLGGGPPHFTAGMIAEVTVEG